MRRVTHLQGTQRSCQRKKYNKSAQWTHIEWLLVSNIFNSGFPLFYPIKFPDFSLTFPWFPKIPPWFFLSFHQDILAKRTIFIFFKCGLSDISLCKYCLIKCNFLSVPEKAFAVFKKHFPQIKRFKNSFEKSSLIWKFFPWFWLKTLLFFPDFTDWKKSSKIFLFSLISLIGGKPVQCIMVPSHGTKPRPTPMFWKGCTVYADLHENVIPSKSQKEVSLVTIAMSTRKFSKRVHMWLLV